MDFNRNQNQSMQFPSNTSSTRPAQIHNYMPAQAPRGVSPSHNQGQHFMNQLNQNIQGFWRDQMAEIEAITDARAAHVIPIARVKKIMKADEDVKMLSADTPVVVAKACELFIKELTVRSWMHTQENKRRTLQRDDVANAVRDDNLLVFLQNIVPLVSNPEEPPYEQNNPGVQQPGYAQNNVPATIPYPNLGLHLGYNPMNFQHRNQAFGAFYGESSQQPRGSVLRPPNPRGQPPPSGSYPHFGFN